MYDFFYNFGIPYFFFNLLKIKTVVIKLDFFWHFFLTNEG